jgi:hypothetical protein
VYGYVKGNVHAAGKIEIKKGGSGEWEFDDSTDSDRRRRGLQEFDRNRKGGRREPLNEMALQMLPDVTKSVSATVN